MVNSWSARDKANYAISEFGKLGISHEASLGILGSLAGESGRKLDTKSFNPNDPGRGSFGLAQWNGVRADAFDNYAKTSKFAKDDFRTHIGFITKELQTTERKTLQKMQNPDITRAQAAKAWTNGYERPNQAKANHAGRAKNANYFADLVGTPAQPTKTIDTAVAAISNPPTPQSRPDPVSATAVAQAQPASFDIGRFGPVDAFAAQPAAQTAPSAMNAYAASPSPAAAGAPSPAAAAPGFDMSRFDTPNLAGITQATLAEALAVQAQALAGTPVSTTSPVAPSTTTAFDAFKLDRPEVAYVDPTVAAPNSIQAATAGATQAPAAASAPQQPATFSSILSDAGTAISGAAKGINGFTNGVMTGNPQAAATAIASPDSAVGVARDAQAVAAQTTANTQQKSQGFLQQDATAAAMVGALAGGYFGGPVGAIAGGLVGQGIGKAIGGIASITETQMDKKVDSFAEGIAGGVGRAVDGLFGGLFGGNSSVDSKYGMPSGGWNESSFPNAPSAPSGGGGGGSWDSSLSEQANAAEARGDHGLY